MAVKAAERLRAAERSMSDQGWRDAMRRMALIALLLLTVTTTGTVGFRLLTGGSWLRSAYLAVITLSTLGSRDAGDDAAVMLFVMAYLSFGFGIFTYGAYQLGQMFVDIQFRRHLEKRRMERKIRKLSQHFIVCGMGRMGTTICEFLERRGQPFVVIDVNEDLLAEECQSRGWQYIEGDATDDAVLQDAGITEAKGLATVLATDADNVYVVLTARMLSQRLLIVARASDDSAVQKLQRAGATRVISPFSSGAIKMARYMLSPTVEGFLEINDERGGGGLELADISIPAGSPYVGKQLADTDLRSRGVMIIGILRANGERLLPPPSSATIQAGDSLFAFGDTNVVNSVIATSEGGMS